MYDWRAKLIVGVTIACLLGTGAFYYFHVGLDPATHFGAVFAAWVGGLALFVVAGSVVAIVSLVRAEEESFDARARILFRRQTGKHIDYIVSKITQVLEHYSELTKVKVSIRDYEQNEKKYLVTSSNVVMVRSYLDDVQTTYSSNYDLKNVTLPPAGGVHNRLVYFRVAGDPVGTGEEFTTDFSRAISCRIEVDGVCEVSHLVEFWIAADDEPNKHRPRRYTQALTLDVENLLPSGNPVEIKLTLDGTNWITERLPHGKCRKVLELKDLEPGTLAFDYRLMAP